MGRIRRGGFIFEWWVGDHPPRHIHISDADGNLLGRIRLDTKESLSAWKPTKKVLEVIDDLQKEGRL